MNDSGQKDSSISASIFKQLAERVHETWMARRLSEGWKVGDQRDDEAKTHPCLVPYDQLPDSEKEYDRATATETLRMIQELGYEIVPKDREEDQ